MDNNSDALSKITINGQEFDPTEASELIETGRKTREMEQKWNTKLDNVWPEYGRSQQELKRLAGVEKELETARQQLNGYTSRQKEGIDQTPAQEREALEAARKLGLATREDLDKAGYISKDSLEQLLAEREQKIAQEAAARNAVLRQAGDLESKIDGADGRPAFNQKQVLAYASAYGFSDLNAAYEDMWKPQLDAWKQSQLERERAKGLKTLQGGAPKEPKTPRVTNSNSRSILSEALWGTNE